MNSLLSCFNPLHCGAVVASPVLGCWEGNLLFMFQSPSLRGSGRFNAHSPQGGGQGGKVSIPFIAGQWSLRRFASGSEKSRKRFQSPSLRGSGRFAARLGDDLAEARVFQSPSLRGSGRFLVERLRNVLENDVSIPFIAGQWSLHWCAGPPQVTSRTGFNPLHCGAVVASHPGPGGGDSGVRVSIPFIAGQWSLPFLRP